MTSESEGEGEISYENVHSMLIVDTNRTSIRDVRTQLRTKNKLFDVSLEREEDLTWMQRKNDQNSNYDDFVDLTVTRKSISGSMLNAQNENTNV
jgi:hypothetical protein